MPQYMTMHNLLVRHCLIVNCLKAGNIKLELPINFSFNVAIIDLVRSRYHGPPLPDETYRALFAPFIGP